MSILLVVSQVNDDDELEDIITEIDGIKTNNKNFSEEAKEALATLVKNDRVVRFPKPKHIKD